MSDEKKAKSSKLLEEKLIKIIKEKKLKPGDYFMSESEIKDLLDASRSAVYQVLLILKIKGVIYQDELKNNRISPMFELYLNDEKVQYEKIDNSVCLPTTNVVPSSIVKKYDFYEDYSKKTNYISFVTLNFNDESSFIPHSYEINWANNKIFDNFLVSDITTKGFLQKFLNKESSVIFNSIQEIHFEPKSKSDINIFKDELNGEKKIPTTYTIDYDSYGNVVNIKIKKTSPKHFKHYNYRSQVHVYK